MFVAIKFDIDRVGTRLKWNVMIRGEIRESVRHIVENWLKKG